MPNLSVFEKAVVKPSSKKEAKKSTRPSHEVEGLKELAAISTVADALKAEVEVRSGEVKARVTEAFLDEGRVLSRRPENFRGEEDGATASVELRKRSTKSPLTDEQLELCKKHGIEVVAVEEPSISVNPEYFKPEHVELMTKISKVLEKVAGFPADFFVTNEKKFGVTEKGIDQVFALTKRDDTKELLPLATTIAVGKFNPNQELAESVRVALEALGLKIEDLA